MNPSKICETTAIVNLAIPHPGVVLDEWFHVAPAFWWRRPPFYADWTVADVSLKARVPVAEVIATLADVEGQCEGIALQPQAFSRALEDRTIAVCDVRSPEECQRDRRHGVSYLSRALWETLKTSRQPVVFVSSSGIRSFSAALFARRHEKLPAQFLSGGLLSCQASQ